MSFIQSMLENPMMEAQQLPVLTELWQHYQSQRGFEIGLSIELLLIVAALLIGWYCSRFTLKRVAASDRLGVFHREGLNRVLFPLLSYCVLQVGVLVLKHWQDVHLIRFANSLLVAMMLIRGAVYLFRKVFPQATWVIKSERWIALTVWLGVVLHLTGLLPELIRLLDDTTFTLGKTRFSLLLIINGVFSVAITMLAALWVGAELERRVMRLENLDISLRVVTTKVIRTALIVVGVLIALPLVGIDLTVLSVFGGAVGVGLGFGLQKIASNYVSGFIILLDRSIRIGDIVQIDGRQGTITAMTARYLVLKAADGTEAIIPNETLITSTVVNQSYNDKNLRVTVPVSVAYGTDLDQVIELMRAIAIGNDRVLKEPKPQVFVTAFADSGINLELTVWISDPEAGVMALRSQLNLAIWRSFKLHHIEIPYPRQDIHILNWQSKDGQAA